MPENHAPADASGNLAATDRAVMAEQVRLLMQNPADVPINVTNAGLVSLIVWPLYPAWVLALWLGLVCTVSLARAVMRRRYAGAAGAAATSPKWARDFTLNAFMAGCLWGLAASVILMTPDPTYYDFIVFVLGGTMAGGIVCVAAYLPAMLAFILPTILPAIGALAIRGGLVQTEMAVMLALFTCALVWTGRSINRSIVENVRFRIGQENLVIKLRSSEAAMAEAQKIARVGSWTIDLDTNTDIWSTETYHILGVDPATFTPSFEGLLLCVHPDDRKSVHEDYARILATGTSPGLDHRIVMDDGTIKYVHEKSRVTHDAAGRVVRLYGTVQDVTERKDAENKIQFANVLLKTQMEASLDGILIVDKSKRIVSFNARLARIWKIPPAELTAGEDDAVLATVASSVKDSHTFIGRVQHLYDHPGEDSHDELETVDNRFIDRYTVTLYGPAREYLGRAWFFRDITERKRVETLALRMAGYDVLTGLANRAVFVEALQRAIAAAKRGNKSFAVLYLDLDHFKDVNDTLGHPVGDKLLKAVADRLRGNTRETDTVARFGGDEFAIIAADIRDPADAAVVANKLIAAFGAPFAVEGGEIHSGASIGIAAYGPQAADAETLLSHADVALYWAKSEGGSGYRFFTDVMDTEVKLRVALEAELRVAVDEGQLFLMYQPQVAIDSGRITGMEALVRWRHPVRGVLGPNLFIPIAERIGIIAKLGHWVLWEACRQAKAWLDAGLAPVRMSVNVSALQFRAPVALEADIAAALAQTGLPPEMLELELTESALIDASREHSDLLERLRETGVTIAIDDFGTGYSSPDYLRRFPSNRIKIAQDFVTNLETTSGDAAIVRATIGLARELNMNVIAEGVETQAQCDLLRNWGCAEVQGFYFARPLAAEDAAAVLRNGIIRAPQTDTVEPKH
jgi:diguanylate cyclase (GGDEF)-like protein/PAS domain S-box-containing protein